MSIKPLPIDKTRAFCYPRAPYATDEPTETSTVSDEEAQQEPQKLYRVNPDSWYPDNVPPNKLDPNDPYKQTHMSIDQAAAKAGVKPKALYQWIRDGWLTPEEAVKKSHGLWYFNTHALCRMHWLGKEGRRSLYGQARPESKEDEARELLRTGWPRKTFKRLSYRQAGIIAGVSHKTVWMWVQENLMRTPDEILPQDMQPGRVFNLDMLVALGKMWEEDGEINGRLKKQRGYNRHVRRRESQERLSDFEGGYVEPSKRPIPVPEEDLALLKEEGLTLNQAIKLQRRAELDLGYALGKKKRGRPLGSKNKSQGKPSKGKIRKKAAAASE